jgi:hypothetical protein
MTPRCVNQSLSRPLDVYASIPANPVAGDSAVTAARELRAQAEGDTSSPQAGVVRDLLTQIDAAIQARNQLEMNRLTVQLRKL